MEKKELAFGRIPAYRKYELFMERYRSGAEIIRNQLELSPDTSFLDIGCGEGYMKYFFDEEEGSWNGVECWKERAEVCTKLGYSVTDIDINTTPLPYKNESMDVVIASHVIEHLSNIEFSLKEMDRVLKEGGIILIATPTKPPVIAQIVQFIHNLFSKELGETQHAFTASSLEKFVCGHLNNYELIDKRGFRIFSARKRLPLENSKLFYKISTFLGKHLTFLTPEINLILKKT